MRRRPIAGQQMNISGPCRGRSQTRVVRRKATGNDGSNDPVQPMRTQDVDGRKARGREGESSFSVERIYFPSTLSAEQTLSLLHASLSPP